MLISVRAYFNAVDCRAAFAKSSGRPRTAILLLNKPVLIQFSIRWNSLDVGINPSKCESL